MTDQEMEALKSRISMLQILYALLFGASLVIIVLQGTSVGFSSGSTMAWACTLGGAVATRIYRTSLVNKYNNELIARTGTPPPLA